MNISTDHKLNVNAVAGTARGARAGACLPMAGARRVRRWIPRCEVAALKPSADKPNQRGRTPSGPPFFVAQMGSEKQMHEHVHPSQQDPMS